MFVGTDAPRPFNTRLNSPFQLEKVLGEEPKGTESLSSGKQKGQDEGLSCYSSSTRKIGKGITSPTRRPGLGEYPTHPNESGDWKETRMS